MSATSKAFEHIKQRTPPSLRRLWRRVRRWSLDRRDRRASIRDVFTEIYQTGSWGADEDADYYSGPGSESLAATPYTKFVCDFMAEHGIGDVIDLGCGDFRVGGLIAPSCTRYTGIDVVAPLIEENMRRHGSEKIRFLAKDITVDPLPDAELCLIREVLQHLSNAEIQAILSQVRKYPYVLVTDTQPENPRGYRINRDKAHGAITRMEYNSILRLDRLPFNVPDIKPVLEVEIPLVAGASIYGRNYRLQTFLIRNGAGALTDRAAE